MKKNFWIVALVIVFAIFGLMSIIEYAFAKPEKVTFKEVTEETRFEDDFDYREVYTDYGDIAVNWYYGFKDGKYSEPLYEVIYKTTGERRWESKEAIVETIANIRQTEYFQ